MYFYTKVTNNVFNFCNTTNHLLIGIIKLRLKK